MSQEGGNISLPLVAQAGDRIETEDGSWEIAYPEGPDADPRDMMVLEPTDESSEQLYLQHEDEFQTFLDGVSRFTLEKKSHDLTQRPEDG